MWAKANRARVQERQTAWRQANRDHQREVERARYARDREAGRAAARAWRKRNPDRAREVNRAWRAANPEKRRELNRRALERRRHGGDDPETLAYLKILRSDPCVYCGGPGGTLEHIVPAARGGANHHSNYASACLSCNARKNATPLLRFLAIRSLQAAECG